MLTDSPRFDALYRTWTDPYTAGRYALESNCGESGNIYQKQVGDFNELLRKLGIPVRYDESALEAALSGEGPRNSTLVYMGPGLCDFSSSGAVQNQIRHDMKHENLFLNYFAACIENTAFAVAANIAPLEEIAPEKPDDSAVVIDVSKEKDTGDVKDGDLRKLGWEEYGKKLKDRNKSFNKDKKK